ASPAMTECLQMSNYFWASVKQSQGSRAKSLCLVGRHQGRPCEALLSSSIFSFNSIGSVAKEEQLVCSSLTTEYYSLNRSQNPSRQRPTRSCSPPPFPSR